MQYQPTGHGSVLTVAPGWHMMPGEQAVHDGEAGAGEKKPSPHSVQVRAPAIEVEPAGHAEHVAFELWLVSAEAVPAEHARGAAPRPGQKKPAGHATVLFVAPPLHQTPGLQAAGAAAAAQKKPAGHGTELLVAPPAQKIPSEHGAQARGFAE
jgi:hypothetical protein